MWVRRTETGWRLALPLQVAAVVVGIGSAVVTALAIYATMTVGWVELMYVVPTGLATTLMFRTASLSVDVLPSGMRIRNVVRTTFVPWDRYAGASVGRWRGWRCMGLVNRTEGEAVPLFVFVINPLFEDTHVQDVVAELEEWAMREHLSDLGR